MSEFAVEMDGVSKIYGRTVKTHALKEVNLRVEMGEFAAILGPSGSGKSTLLNILGALDKPTEGNVQICGSSLSDLDSDGLSLLRRRELGFIFQFHYLLPEFTALENVMMPTDIRGSQFSASARDQAMLLLDKVGLSGKQNSRQSELSGGQQQRVSIARALAGNRRLVLADEPTGNLDTKNGVEVFELMRELNRSIGTTFLIVTHDLKLAEKTDRIIEVVDGQIRFDGSPSCYGLI